MFAGCRVKMSNLLCQINRKYLMDEAYRLNVVKMLLLSLIPSLRFLQGLIPTLISNHWPGYEAI